MHANEVLSELPLKYVGVSHCFRREAGRGNYSKGLFRLHQFSKTELFIFCRPEESERLHWELLEFQKALFS